MPQINILNNLRDLESPQGRRLQKELRGHLVRQGWAHVPQFLSSDVTSAMVSECLRLEKNENGSGSSSSSSSSAGGGGGAFLSTESHTVHQEEHDPNFPDHHPRNALQQSSKFILDYDTLPSHSPLRNLYAREDLRKFIESVVLDYLPANAAGGKLHFSACDYNAAYYNIYREGHGLGWHFDRSAFGVNLILKMPSCVPGGAGGEFEWCAHTRSSLTGGDPWEFDRVGAILSEKASDDDEVATVNVSPGSLVIFAGIESLHRVTPVICNQNIEEMNQTVERINAILTYETEPDQRMKTRSTTSRGFHHQNG